MSSITSHHIIGLVAITIAILVYFIILKRDTQCRAILPKDIFSSSKQTMSNVNTFTQQQTGNDDKSVFNEQDRVKISSEVNGYGTDMTNNSANVESQCKGCDTG